MVDEVLRNKVISNLRACLLSAKGGVSFSALNSDYKQLVGENIPFRKIGYQSLDEFLTNVDGLVITKKGGDWNVAARPTEDSIHLTRLIARQKSAPRRRARGPAVRHRRPSVTPRKRLVTFQTTRPMQHASRDLHMNQRPSQSHRPSNVAPLLPTPQKKQIPSLFETPRYMFSNSQTPQTSPSKRLSDRMANNGVNNLPSNSSSYQTSTNTNNQGPSVIAFKNRTAAQPMMNERLVKQTPTSLSTPPLQPLATTPRATTSRDNTTPLRTPQLQPLATTPRATTSRDNTTPLKPLSERLRVKLPQQPVQKSPSMILSPLTPSQLVNGDAGLKSMTSTTAPVLRSAPITPTRNESQPQITSWSLNVPNQDPCKQLELLANALKLSAPVYKIRPWDQKRQQKGYIGQVKVGNDSYSTYPEEIMTSEAAKKGAATKAVRAILEKDGPLCGLSETTNKNLVKERVLAIVADHENGVFMHLIPNYYKEQYRENLPEEWEKIIEECSEISKEKGAHDSTILRPYVPRTEIYDPDKAIEALSPRLEKIQLNPIGPPIPDTLKLPNEQYWDVSITSVLSTVDIWARLIGEEYSEKLDIMLNEMECWYKNHNSITSASLIEPGSYYAVQEEGTFHRVQCFEFDPSTGKTGVFFIDHGDEDFFHYSKLLPLEKRFCTVPAQAVNLCLADLEEFNDCFEVMEYLEELLLGEPLIAQVITRENLDGDEWIASVVLYDTKNSSDVNLNDVLLKRICENILIPKLNQDGQVSEVYTSHVTDTGDVYLQVKSRSLYYLKNMMNKLIQTGLTTEDVRRSEPDKIVMQKVYLARCFEDGNWYRGVPTHIGANHNIQVFLVDIGKTIVVDKKNHLLDLDQLSEVLTKYPYQAIKVRLHNIPESMFNAEMAGKLVALAPPKDQLLVTVVTPASNSSPPVVELFKRVEPDNLLVSINHTLAIDPELIGSSGDGNNNTRPRKRLERTISRHGTMGDGEVITRNLKPPRIPGFGEYFDVHITMAANPGNFTVQPFDDRTHLEAMMVQLQEVCVNYKGPLLSNQTIKEGSLYAAKHIDSHYYRVCISKILDDHLVTVYFCDFGDVSVLTLDKLQPLGRQFLDLPYQAIKARLIGVQPLHIDWSVEDCLRFQELVVENNFVSIVVDSGPDPLSPGDTVLGLKLIDVSGNTDVYLDSLLINEGRATSIEG